MGLTRASASDAVQETMLAISQQIRSGKAAYLESRGSVKSWLWGIARHKVLDIQNRALGRSARRAHRAPGAPEPDGRAGREVEFEEQWRRHQLRMALDMVAREVDPVAFQAFHLHAVEGMAPSQVAALLGMSRNAVYIHKHKLLRRIRTIVADLQAADS
jgi:RNA polymerase sigma-70 factor (ECF subfamily)